MPVPMAITEYPDDVSEHTWSLQMFAATADLSGYMLYFPGRKFVVDELWIWVGDANTAGAVEFMRVDDGEALTAGEALTTPQSVAAVDTARDVAALLSGSYPIEFSATQGLALNVSTSTTSDGLLVVGARIRTRF